MTTDRAQRIRRLRRLTVRGGIAAFLTAWAILFGQLVSGHDPAVGQQHKSQKQSNAAATGSDDSESQSSDDSSSSTSSGTGSTSSSPAPVTTSQS